MNIIKTKTLPLLLSVAVFSSVLSAQTPGPTPIHLKLLDNDAELRAVYLGIVGENGPRLSSEMWTLTHAYDSKVEVDRVLNFFAEFFQAVESNDAELVTKLGGAKGFKDKFAKFLDSKDQAVKGFSAFILGASGDKSYAPKLAKLVNQRDPSFEDRFAGERAFYRGRAAMALGMLEAQEFKIDIAKLLKSKNEYDRSGAIHALADLSAVEYTKDIVSILSDEEFEFDDDDSPLYFLYETKQLAGFKKETAQLIRRPYSSKMKESAAFALASVGAKEHAKDIAVLLNDPYRRGVAMKALALLEAKEYLQQIATFLNDESSLVVADAAISLGILGAEKYSKELSATITKHNASGASVSAAEAIFLIGATDHYDRARAVIEFKIYERPFPMAGDFHHFVENKIESVRKRLEIKLDKILQK